jgi:hypothetical protein
LFQELVCFNSLRLVSIKRCCKHLRSLNLWLICCSSRCFEPARECYFARFTSAQERWKEVGPAAPSGPAASTFGKQMQNQWHAGNHDAPEIAHEARHKFWVGRPHHLGPAAPTFSTRTEHLHAKSRWFESLTQLTMLSYGYPIYFA